MKFYRITAKDYGNDISGVGGVKREGRWHPKGIAILYASSVLSIALIETGVEREDYDDFVCQEFDIPDDKIIDLEVPVNWASSPFKSESQKCGEQFLLSNKALAARVPSTKIDLTHPLQPCNLIINPLHPDFQGVTIRTIHLFNI